MNRGALIFLGVFFALATSWFGLVLMPQLEIGGQQPDKADLLAKLESRENWKLRERGLPVKDEGFGSIYPTTPAGMAKQGVGAFVISTEALFNVWRDQVIGLSASTGIAAMFPNREYVLAGGLISYGADFYEHYRVAGTYAGRILKGEKPADIPVQLPTKTEMVINLKTAKALGLTIPQTLLRDASEVIE